MSVNFELLKIETNERFELNNFDWLAIFRETPSVRTTVFKEKGGYKYTSFLFGFMSFEIPCYFESIDELYKNIIFNSIETADKNLKLYDFYEIAQKIWGWAKSDRIVLMSDCNYIFERILKSKRPDIGSDYISKQFPVTGSLWKY